MLAIQNVVNDNDSIVDDLFEVRQHSVIWVHSFSPPIVDKAERFCMQYKENLFRMAIQATECLELTTLGLYIVVPCWHLTFFVHVKIGPKTARNVD